MKTPLNLLLLIFLIITTNSCKSTSKTFPTPTEENLIQTTSPNIIIYKTNSDYKNLVPIKLSKDKSQIVSYPSPTDLQKNGIFLTPTELKNGYLKDNIGISDQTVFINITYEEYAKRKTTLLLEDMLKLIIDKDPFIEMYDCGKNDNSSNFLEEINKEILNGNLNQKFKKIR